MHYISCFNRNYNTDICSRRCKYRFDCKRYYGHIKKTEQENKENKSENK